MDLSALNDRLLFAVPKKGRLYEHCLSLLKGIDIQFTRKNRLDIALSTNHPIALVFLPAADIARFVADGNIDIGITGQDMIAEAGVNVIELVKLGFGKCKLCVQVPVDSGIEDVKGLVGKRIVTSFDGLAKRFFENLEKEMGVEVGGTCINYVSGSVEAACALGLADGIVDLVESGETMRAAKLHAITTVLETESVLICNPRKYRNITSPNPTPNQQSQYSLLRTVQRRVQGVLDASKYALITYNIQRDLLKLAEEITPGKKGPTVSPLDVDGWVAVSSMVVKSQSAEIMDRLENLGATDILILNIQNCRLGFE
ncbi:ATP phosphoribosyltransferase (ATP-PRTase) (ATP-PRT) [Quaeritorhiza haematococci]|nr:ATP phosphoribosyltransferase (ATP-PRTase) (ATP-PRT) [Quaeritorhiza haematococci]